MLLLLSYLTIITMISTIILSLPMFMKMMTKTWLESSSSFECGMNPNSMTRNPLSVRFFFTYSIIYCIWHRGYINYCWTTSNTYNLTNTIIFHHIHYSTTFWSPLRVARSILKLKAMISTMTALMTMVVTTTMTLLVSNNPMSTIFIIITLTIISSMTITLYSSPWFAMILLLIYIGGMMVMFSYFVGLSSNDPMLIKTKPHLFFLFAIMVECLNLQELYPVYTKSQINKLYSSNNVTVLTMIMVVLLMMMIIVVKMMKMNDGPLRGFNTFN